MVISAPGASGGAFEAAGEIGEARPGSERYYTGQAALIQEPEPTLGSPS